MHSPIRSIGNIVTAAALTVGLCFGLAACGTQQASTGQDGSVAAAAQEAPKTVTIKSYNASKEIVDLEVPYNPQRVATLDMPALDILDALGLGDRVVGTAKTQIDYLTGYGDKLPNLGNVKEVDLEAVAKVNPEVIFIGGRLSKSYDELSKIAPVVFLTTDSAKSSVENVRANATTVASIFGKEGDVDAKLAGFKDRIAKLKEASQGQTALVSMFSGSLSALGDDGRGSLIGKELGFKNLANGQSTSTHGNDVSFETIAQENPAWIFVINRAAAIGSEGADQVKSVVENDLVKKTDAYTNGHIVYLEHPAVWYLAEGGITALDVMLGDVEAGVLNK